MCPKHVQVLQQVLKCHHQEQVPGQVLKQVLKQVLECYHQEQVLGKVLQQVLECYHQEQVLGKVLECQHQEKVLQNMFPRTILIEYLHQDKSFSYSFKL